MFEALRMTGLVALILLTGACDSTSDVSATADGTAPIEADADTAETAPPDAQPADASLPDARLPDTQPPDALWPDAQSPDVRLPDALPSDAVWAPDAESAPEILSDWSRDILVVDLNLNLTSLEATARITLAGNDSSAVSLEIGDLEINAVEIDGEPVPFQAVEERLDVTVPNTGEDVVITVRYVFHQHARFDGYLGNGFAFLWPYHCGNLYPCRSEPAEGIRFTLELTGLTPGHTAVYPRQIPIDAPPYMISFAVGDLERRGLGTTTAGTAVSVWYRPAQAAVARAGTTHLMGAFDWLEQTYGPYLLGDSVGSVQAGWPAVAGAMEHHPFWHVAEASMDHAVTHVHEAAHGWFGNGVRIRCWEDFVLSEGVATYLAARALEATAGPAVGEAVWAEYSNDLRESMRQGDTAAWPDGCGEIDILHHPLWSPIPYLKGAYFFRSVEAQVGRDALDAVFAAFYAERVGTAAGMQDLIDAIAAQTPIDADLLDAMVASWLRTDGVPLEP